MTATTTAPAAIAFADDELAEVLQSAIDYRPGVTFAKNRQTLTLSSPNAQFTPVLTLKLNRKGEIASASIALSGQGVMLNRDETFKLAADEVYSYLFRYFM